MDLTPEPASPAIVYPESFRGWLDRRYNQSIWITQLVLDAALGRIRQDNTRAAYVPIRKQILEHGVPATIRDAYADLKLSVRESPEHLQPVMRGLAVAFLDRLRKSHIVELAQ